MADLSELLRKIEERKAFWLRQAGYARNEMGRWQLRPKWRWRFWDRDTRDWWIAEHNRCVAKADELLVVASMLREAGNE